MFDTKTLKKIAIPAALLTAVSIGTFKIVHADSDVLGKKRNHSVMEIPKGPGETPGLNDRAQKPYMAKGEPRLSFKKSEGLGNCLNLAFDGNFYNGGVVDLIDREDNLVISNDLIVNGAYPEFDIPIDEIIERSRNKSVVAIITLSKVNADKDGSDGLQAGIEIRKNGGSFGYRPLSDEETKEYFKILNDNANKEEKEIMPTV